MTNEANIKLVRDNGNRMFVSVVMPIWNKKSEYGHINIKLPLIGMETIAKDEDDIDAAVKEAIESFCLIADKFGQGVEKELQTLGWKVVDEDGEEILGYNLDNVDAVLEKIFETGDNFATENLEILETV